MPEKPDYSKRLEELKKQQKKDGGVIVTCHHCSRPWLCTSELEQVSCPSCGSKTPRLPEKQKK
jgi:hypothetical protein